MSDRELNLKLDEIGYWSEIKLDIIRDYAKAYSTILTAQERPRFHHVYIDAFAGAGVHVSKETGQSVEGSPVIAANTQPPFKEFHFIDLDGSKVDYLRKTFLDRPEIHIHRGDCNRILLQDVFPRVLRKDYRRGLCLLDPYGLHLNWDVIYKAGQMKTIEVFLNFPIADMNRNVFWHNPDGVDAADIERMNAFWGDDSWRKIAYEQERTLFGPVERKTDNETIADAFRQRLRDVGGFATVPAPIPMRNTRGAIVYYLEHQDELDARFAEVDQALDEAHAENRSANADFLDDMRARLERRKSQDGRNGQSSEPPQA
jgi:three-Cys-motif partner protein